MTGVEWAIAATAVAVGALVQGSVGFGLNLIAAPVFLMVDRTLVPGPAAFLGLVLTLMVASRERGSVDRKGVAWAMVGRVPGVVIGAAAVAALSTRSLDITFGVVILIAVGLSAGGWHLRPTPRVLVGAGAVSGFMGTTSSVGGPPMALVYQREPGPIVRGTLAGYFIFGIVLTLISLAIVGRFGVDEIVAGLVLVPPLVLGFVASRWTAGRLDSGLTRLAILLVSGGAAIAVLATAGS